MPRPLQIASLGCVVAVLLAACSSTPKSEFASTLAPATTSTSAAPAGPPDLMQVGLAVSDLPTGWTTATDPTATSLGQAGCLTPASHRKGAARARYFTFTGAGGSPVFSESLAYVGVSKGESAFMAAQKTLDACTTISIKALRYTFTGPMEPMSFPTLGERSKAYVISAKSGAHVLTEYVLLTQEGDVLLMTTYASVKNGNITDFLGYTEKAITKVAAARPSTS